MLQLCRLVHQVGFLLFLRQAKKSRPFFQRTLTDLSAAVLLRPFRGQNQQNFAQPICKEGSKTCQK